MLHNGLIPSDLIKCFAKTHKKFEKLPNDLYVITIYLANFTSKEGHNQRNTILEYP
jgi:hypothetical protein